MTPRIVFALGIAGGLYLTLQPAWSELCRRSALLMLSVMPFSAVEVEGGVQVAHVHVPWSEACSGLNTLAVMLGLAVWIGLPSSLGALVRRLGLAIFVALVANASRAALIAIGRVALAPSWEGESLHFFAGFVCIAAGVAVFARIEGARAELSPARWIHAACVLSVVSVVSTWPGGSLAAASALVCLLFTATAAPAQPRWFAVAAWVVCGGAIAASQMESLWLPWLLACPYFGGAALLRSVPGWVAWLGTIPLLSMKPLWWWVEVPALLVVAHRALRGSERIEEERSPEASGRPFWVPALASVAIPFVVPLFIVGSDTPVLPSPELMPKSVSRSAYLVRVPGQGADLAVLWFGSSRGGRHHSLESCLKLRDVNAQRVGTVLEREDVWMTEFFLQAGRLHETYASYLWSSALPWSPRGVHIIVQSPRDAMDADYFARESRRIADALAGTVHGRPAPVASGSRWGG